MARGQPLLVEDKSPPVVFLLCFANTRTGAGQSITITDAAEAPSTHISKISRIPRRGSTSESRRGMLSVLVRGVISGRGLALWLDVVLTPVKAFLKPEICLNRYA